MKKKARYCYYLNRSLTVTALVMLPDGIDLNPLMARLGLSNEDFVWWLSHPVEVSSDQLSKLFDYYGSQGINAFFEAQLAAQRLVENDPFSDSVAQELIH